jgi:signal transduction histidine kinase
MNAILGWLSILRSGKPVAEPASALAVIQRNAQLQARLIDDLLDMTRLMLGNMPLETGTVDLSALLQAAMQGIQPIALEKGVELVRHLNGTLPPLEGDARRLQQVVWNLLHNAVKFTPRGGRIELRAGTGAEEVVVEVVDNGRGIDPEFLPYVFERFRQEDSSATRESFGLGIGLSIAKHLVELHGGHIEARSEGEGLGASFTVRLPLAATARAPEQPISASGASA